MRFTAILCALALSQSVGHAAWASDDKPQSREVRTLQKEVAKLEKRYDKLIKRCTGDERNRPDARACDTARVIYQDVQEIKKRLVTLTKG